MIAGQWPSSMSGSPPSTEPGFTFHEESPVQVWEGGKRGSMLDVTLLDGDWSKVQPHQRTPIDAGHLRRLLAASAYDETKSNYLVEGFREGFHLRLDRPVHQIVKDRTLMPEP